MGFNPHHPIHHHSPSFTILLRKIHHHSYVQPQNTMTSIFGDDGPLQGRAAACPCRGMAERSHRRSPSPSRCGNGPESAAGLRDVGELVAWNFGRSWEVWASKSRLQHHVQTWHRNIYLLSLCIWIDVSGSSDFLFLSFSELFRTRKKTLVQWGSFQVWKVPTSKWSNDCGLLTYPDQDIQDIQDHPQRFDSATPHLLINNINNSSECANCGMRHLNRSNDLTFSTGPPLYGPTDPIIIGDP